MTKKRLEGQAEMMRELYLQASFFKMKTVGSTNIDRQINVLSGAQIPFSNVNNPVRFQPPREKMPKFPKGK